MNIFSNKLDCLKSIFLFKDFRWTLYTKLKKYTERCAIQNELLKFKKRILLKKVNLKVKSVMLM